MKTDQIRESYLSFYAAKGHKRVNSDSLVPHNDPTLLFTGAGMNQFKEYFLGLKKDLKRATSSQKCIRTGDLDNVGKTAYHHSFFEMLGNFSFGDYFKEEAITWAWEYLTEVLQIPKERLRVSIHHSDDEARRIWKEKIKIREDWIYPLGDESNFWPANAPKDGPNGPCGPCSEIYFDMGMECLRPGEDPEDIESKRFAEIWNLVFTQFDRQGVEKLVPLANKNIDTGMGLERLACVMQGKKSNFEIDIFQPIHQAVETELKVRREGKSISSMNAIADHVRGIVFSMADGVIPSNEGRGYVIRKLIRRALWHAQQLVSGNHLEGAFLYRVVPSVIQVMKTAYPELSSAQGSIQSTLKGEEERFLDTLETGLRILSQRLEKLKATGVKEIPGDIIFELYDTYGFPDELTRIIAESRGLTLDQAGFERLMEEQRTRAKQSSQIADSIFVSTDLEKKIIGQPGTEFLGYEKHESDAKVLLAELQDGKGVIVLDRTPFYAESGGQVGDQGELSGDGFKARVLDTQKKDKVFIHYVEIMTGKVNPGQKVNARIDMSRRDAIMRNHTATHILHAALRNILGDQVRQLGSLVAPERLRFDFSYPQAVTAGQIRDIEAAVNREILKNAVVSKIEKPIDEARKEGAIAFFGEKYGDVVRVVSVPGFSKEFCGGVHCEGTGQIGAFVIISESSVASGTRRIEALTGEGALDYMQRLRQQVNELAQELKTTPAQLAERVKKMKDQMKKLEKTKSEGRVSSADPKQILEKAVSAGTVQFAAYREKEMDVSVLRSLSDALKTQAKATVYFLASESDEKFQFLLGASQDLKSSSLDLNTLMKELSPLLGTSGGGRKDLVQGGGRNDGQVAAQWSKISDTAVQFLKNINLTVKSK